MASQKFIGTYHYVPSGYGYVTLKGDVSENAVVVSPFSPGVFEGDIVEVTANGEKDPASFRRCKINSVVSRAQTFVTGEYTVCDNKAYVIPDSYIPFRIQVRSVAGGIKCDPGDKVAANLLKYKAISALRVEVVENFGRNDTFGANLKAAYYSTPLFSPFGEDVEKQVSLLKMPDLSKLLTKRVDLRGKTVFTFADSVFGSSVSAFSLSQTDDQKTIGLHILDIDELVPRSSPLDTEAFRRGRSVRIERDDSPMFPRSFTTSAGTFSEKKASPAVSVFVTFDSDGNVLDTEFCKSVVEPVIVTSGSDIDALFSGSDSSALLPLRQKYSPVLELITSLYELSATLRRARISRGGVDFDVTERVFGFDSDKRIRHLSLETKDDSFLMINEIMIAIGQAAAEKLYYGGAQCVYSSLSEPVYDKLTGVPNSKVLLPESDYLVPGYTKRESSAVKGTGFEKFTYLSITDDCDCPVLSFTPYSHYIYKSDIFADFFDPTDRYSALVNLRAIKAYIDEEPFDIRPFENAFVNESAYSSVKQRICHLMTVGYLEQNVGKAHNAAVIKHISGGCRAILDCGLIGFLPFESGENVAAGTNIKVTVSESDYSTGRIILKRL